MYSVLLTLLENSIFAAALFAGVWLIKSLFRHKLSAGMHYMIWAIVVIKLILPIQLPMTLSPWNLMPQQASVIQAVTPNLTVGAAEQAVNTETKTQYETAPPELPAEAVDSVISSVKPSAVPENTYPLSWEDAASAIWICGMAAMVFWFALGIRRLKRNAMDSSPAPEWAAELFEKCKTELNIKRRVRLSLEKIAVPAVRGVFRPVVMLPISLPEVKDEEGMRLIMLHELLHIKRGDIAVTYILNIINIIYWFNPVVWLMAKLISADIETACDASVLGVLGMEKRQPYIRTLVRFAGVEKLMQPLLCLSDSGTNMKRRIEGMFLDKKTKRTVRAAVTFMVCLLAAVCFTSACQPASTVSAPNHYTAAAAVKSDYNVTVNFDADVDAPGAAKYPVYTIDKDPRFSGGEKQNVVNYFLSSNSTYKGSGEYYVFPKADGSKSQLKLNLSNIHYDSNTNNKIEYDFTDEKQPGGVKMSKEEATKSAQKMLGAMLINNTKLYDVCISEVKAGEKDTQCWTLKYYRTFGGIPLSNFCGAPDVDLINADYTTEKYYKTGNSEIISISLDDSGLLGFDWSNPVTVTGTAEDNVKLLKFGDIMDIARSKMYYKAEEETDAGAVSYYDAKVNIKSINLSYSIVESKDGKSQYLMIPVWKFIGDVDAKCTTNIKGDEKGSFFNIDAVNGSILY